MALLATRPHGRSRIRPWFACAVALLAASVALGAGTPSATGAGAAAIELPVGEAWPAAAAWGNTGLQHGAEVLRSNASGPNHDGGRDPNEKRYKPGREVTIALFVSSGLSCIACIFVLVSSWMCRRLQRHPSGIIIARSVADLLFCFDICASHFLTYFGAIKDMDADDGDCIVLSALAQVAGITAELYIACLALDLVISLNNPFTNTKSNMKAYHIGVAVVGITSAILLLTVQQDGHPIYGRDNFLDICWIRRYSGSHGEHESVWFSVLFNAPLGIIYAFASFAFVFVRVRLDRGLRETVRERAEVMRNSQRIVLAYLSYWGIAALVFTLISLLDNNDPPFSLSFVFAFALGARGLVTGIVWIFTQDFGKAFRLWRTATSMNSPQVTDLRPQINVALRREVLHYTTLGIRKAVRYAQLLERASRPDRRTARSGGRSGRSSLADLTDARAKDGGHAASAQGRADKASRGPGTSTLAARSASRARGLHREPAWHWGSEPIPEGASQLTMANCPVPAGRGAGGAGSGEDDSALSLPGSASTVLFGGLDEDKVDMQADLAAIQKEDEWLGDDAEERLEAEAEAGGEELLRQLQTGSASFHSDESSEGDDRPGSCAASSGRDARPVGPSAAQAAAQPASSQSRLMGDLAASAQRQAAGKSAPRFEPGALAPIRRPRSRRPAKLAEWGGGDRLDAEDREAELSDEGSHASDLEDDDLSPHAHPSELGTPRRSGSLARLHGSARVAKGRPAGWSARALELDDDNFPEPSPLARPSSSNSAAKHARAGFARPPPAPLGSLAAAPAIGSPLAVPQHVHDAARAPKSDGPSQHPMLEFSKGRFPTPRSSGHNLARSVAARSIPLSDPSVEIRRRDMAGVRRIRGTSSGFRGFLSGFLIPTLTCGTGCCRSRAGRGRRRRDRFVFYDFAPQLFRRVRQLSGISNFDYTLALQITKREKFSEGASGAFLYFSEDERFIVKTTEATEMESLVGILPSYVQHLERNPNSLLTRFLGCHAIRMYGHTMFFVVINNVITGGGRRIHERYDLKGSWVNRHHKPVERGKYTACRHCGERFRVGDKTTMCPSCPNRGHAFNTVMKDNDLTTKLRLEPRLSAAIAMQIGRDCGFLRANGIMDYSLLLGVHRSRYAMVTRAPPGPADIMAAAATGTTPLWVSPSMQPAASGDMQAALAAAAGGAPGASVPGMPAYTHCLRGSLAMDASSRRGPLARVRSDGLASRASSQSLQNGVIFREIIDDTPRAIEGPGSASLFKGQAHRAPEVPVELVLLDYSPTAARAVPQGPSQPPALSIGPPDRVFAPSRPASQYSGGLVVGGALARAGSGPVSQAAHPAPPPGPSQAERAESFTTSEAAAARAGLAVWSDGAGDAVPASPKTLADAVPTEAFREILDRASALRAKARAPAAVAAAGVGGRASLPYSSPHADAAVPGWATAPLDPHMQELTPEQAKAAALALRQSAEEVLNRPGALTEHHGGLRAKIVEGPSLYYMGLIDILQRYTWEKRLENFVKTRLLCRSSRGISAIPPDEYGRRFEGRVVDQLFDQYHGELHEFAIDDDSPRHLEPSCWASLCLRLCCMRDDE
ncbi:hypothetical protein FNF28_05804 [Cafeteria roenbergensis]|uniref:PIPK domain-containing protein n=1 Tax=Cafeteria roenbergensis TaxID=33653 RepID=A0A5A8D5S0_CAFRO|nr:hypothetical protein FNF28_05804 [Cafeteria roenbergensis]